LGEREDCAETAVDIAPKRDNLLQQLLTILNTDIEFPLHAPPVDDVAPTSVIVSQISVLSMFTVTVMVVVGRLTEAVGCLEGQIQRP